MLMCVSPLPHHKDTLFTPLSFTVEDPIYDGGEGRLQSADISGHRLYQIHTVGGCMLYTTLCYVGLLIQVIFYFVDVNLCFDQLSTSQVY